MGGIGALHMARMLIDNDYISELVRLTLLYINSKNVTCECLNFAQKYM